MNRASLSLSLVTTVALASGLFLVSTATQAASVTRAEVAQQTQAAARRDVERARTGPNDALYRWDDAATGELSFAPPAAGRAPASATVAAPASASGAAAGQEPPAAR